MDYFTEICGFRCKIEHVNQEADLFINDKHVIHSSGPERLVEMMQSGFTGHEDWTQEHYDQVPDLKKWRLE